MKDCLIKEEWEEYYKTLEAIRRSGICNMYGASPYLAELTGLDEPLCREILVNWMNNYAELSHMYGWN